ncbi:alcohol dehydrogenase catalytic domain-containing protein [Vibrio hannami]|uniref:alcohol dehydrogenase catalytic domain-containing protein n=1 Tax=Vibrio hannami TaxID=2717094 RepID=UPI003EBDE346
MTMMKAARLKGKLDVQVEEVAIPEIAENEMLLKVRSASLCGTDVRMYMNGYKEVSPENPLIIGHEFAGEIAKVGSAVKGNYFEGQKVAIAPNIGCGTCDLCVSGQTHLCDDYDAWGVTMDGGFAEYVRIPSFAIEQGNIAPLDDEISYAEASLVEPLSCVYNGQKQINILPGDDVLVVGMGPIGLMHVMVCKLFGAAKVIVADLSEERLAKAKELFPDVYTVKGDLKEGIKEVTGKGVDVSIIAAPAAIAQSESTEYMNMNGKILFFGGLPKDKEMVPLNSNTIHYKQLSIHGCTKQSVYDYRLCSKLVNDKRIPLNLIVSETYSIDEFDKALDNAAAAKGLKHVIAFD